MITQEIYGTPVDTYKQASTNTASALSTTSSGGNNANFAVITAETNAMRYAFGSTPTNDGGTALGHVLGTGDRIVIRGYAAIKNFKVISKVSGSHGVMQVTLYL